MTQERFRVLDSHLHLDIIHETHPEHIDWLKNRGHAVVSWSYHETIRTAEDLRRYLANKADFIRRMNDGGLTCWLLAGVHPRNIPTDLDPAEVPDLLSPFLVDPCCLGIGEIGLETGSDREADMFITQVETARRFKDARIGVHKPRGNKVELTARTLDMLDAFPDLMGRVVVDHATPETIGAILAKGCWAGVTLSPAKVSMDGLKRILAAHESALDRIMLNTDSGSAVYDDLESAASGDAVGPPLAALLTRENARRFYGLEALP